MQEARGERRSGKFSHKRLRGGRMTRKGSGEDRRDDEEENERYVRDVLGMPRPDKNHMKNLASDYFATTSVARKGFRVEGKEKKSQTAARRASGKALFIKLLLCNQRSHFHVFSGFYWRNEHCSARFAALRSRQSTGKLLSCCAT
jgi:hypothetical protein